MAYFERVDTRNDGKPVLVLCNICNVNCAERSITTHKMKCRNKPNHIARFNKGELEACQYDSSHIVAGGQMDIHLEFCNKRQSKIVSEFQLACGNVNKHLSELVSIPVIKEQPRLDDDAWNREINGEQILAKMGQLRLQ